MNLSKNEKTAQMAVEGVVTKRAAQSGNRQAGPLIHGDNGMTPWNLLRKTQGIFTMLALFLVMVVPRNANAQLGTATVNGTVQDTSGAVIPGVEVVLQNVDTGVKTVATSNDAGVYVFVHILPGRYTIAASKAGFATAKEENIVLEVNEATTYDLTMQLGTQKQEVTVQATVAALQTSNAALGSVVTTGEVNDLPLNGRNFTEILALTPGVSPISTAQNGGGGQTSPVGSFVFPAVNGQSNRSNYFMLDGIDDNEQTFSTYSLAPIVDDIEEFKVQSHNDEAQFGGVLGGIVNVVTKSGTNQLHGTVWEFLRNDAVDARDPFALKSSPLKQNQFGANIGGPVVLPHYDGRNKTFFFGSYEGFRQSITETASFYNVPTPAELGGDLSAVKAPIYNPFTTAPDPNNPGEYTRAPFQNNQIPASVLDPHAVAYAKAVFPAPVQLNNGFNGVVNQPQETGQNEYNIRIDEAMNARNQAWFRYSNTSQNMTGGNGVEGYTAVNKFYGKNYGASYTHTFNPTTVLMAVFGHNSYTHSWIYSSPPSVNVASADSAGGWPTNFSCEATSTGGCALVGVNIPGYLNLPGGGISNGFTTLTDVYQWRADFTKIAGNHTISAGADIQTNVILEGGSGSGSLSFSSYQTENPEVSGTGDPLASYLLGVPDSGGHGLPTTTQSHGVMVNGFYIMDRWKASSKLTANIGLRYDYSTWGTFGNVNNGGVYIGNMNFNTGKYELQRAVGSCAQLGVQPCIPGGLPQPNVYVSPNGGLFNPTYDNVQPRIGLAYRLTQNDVIRGAFGVFNDEWAGVLQTAQNMGGNWPHANETVNDMNPATAPPTRTTENPLLGSVFFPPPTPFNLVAFYQDPLVKNPWSNQWTFGVQHQLGTSTVITANYVGSHSTRLMIGEYANTAVTPGPGTAAEVAARQPYPYISPTFYDQSIGRSNYNAFQFSVKHQAGRSLSFLASYTWSKAMDVGCDGFFGVEGCSIQNIYDLNASRSVAGFDLPQIFSFGWVGQSPFGPGQRFDLHNKVANYITGHWRLNGFATLTSGAPYDVGISGDIANTGGNGGTSYGYERLNTVGNPKLANPTTGEWFNTAAFQAPAPYTFGNEGRFSLRGDWSKNLDLSVFREFPVSESKRFEFRVEMFNLTNTPTWGNPVNSFTSPYFGQVLSTRSIQREIQFALKFYL
jgi:hypothetical protein